MTHDREQQYPKDRVVYLKCPHVVLRDVTLCEIRIPNEDPEYIRVPQGTIVMLADDRVVPCRTKEGGRGSGCLYKLTETRGVVLESRYAGRIVVIPDAFVDVREDVL